MTAKFLHAVLPSSPVSVNALYRPDKWGKLVLSKAGKQYKQAVIEHLRQAWLFDLNKFPKTEMYQFRYVVYMPLKELFTVGKTAKHPIQARDVSNFQKALEDSIAELTQIDDRCYFDVRGIKLPVREDEKGNPIEQPRTEVWLFLLDGLDGLKEEIESWPRNE